MKQEGLSLGSLEKAILQTLGPDYKIVEKHVYVES